MAALVACASIVKNAADEELSAPVTLAMAAEKEGPSPLALSSDDSRMKGRQGSGSSQGGRRQSSSKGGDDGGHQVKPSAASVSRTITKLKKVVQQEHNAYVQAELEKNRLFREKIKEKMLAAISSNASEDLAFTEPPIEAPQKTSDGQGKEKSRIWTMMPAVRLVPKYTTWNHISRNQRMTEDQSIVGRRRIYYDAEKDETTVCSESDEEFEAEEYRHDFKMEDDRIIMGTVREHGLSTPVLTELANIFKLPPTEIEKRCLELTSKKVLLEVENSAEKDKHSVVQSSSQLQVNIRATRTASHSSPIKDIEAEDGGLQVGTKAPTSVENTLVCERKSVRKTSLSQSGAMESSSELKGDPILTVEVEGYGGRDISAEHEGKQSRGQALSNGLEGDKSAQVNKGHEKEKETVPTAVTEKVKRVETDKLPEDLETFMDTSDNLFCRRCLVFDCRLHGAIQTPEPHERQPQVNLPSDGRPCGPDCHLQPSHANLLEQLRQSLQNWSGSSHRESESGALPGRDSSSAQEEAAKEGKGEVQEDGKQDEVDGPKQRKSISTVITEDHGKASSLLRGKTHQEGGAGKDHNSQGDVLGGVAERTSLTPVEAGSVCVGAKKFDGDEGQSSPRGARKRKEMKWNRGGRLRGRIGQTAGKTRQRGVAMGAEEGEEDERSHEESGEDGADVEEVVGRARKRRKPNKVHEIKRGRKSIHDEDVVGQSGEGDEGKEELREGQGDNRGEAPQVVDVGESKKEEAIQNLAFPEDKNWSKLDREMYDKAVQMFGYDSCLIARTLKGQKTCAEMAERIIMEMAHLRSTDPKSSAAGEGDDESVGVTLQRRQARKKAKLVHSKVGRGRFRALQPAALQGLRKDKNGRELRRHYSPCACKGQCSKSTCTCFSNGTVCEKYCACSRTCKQRFPGCQCGKSQCSSRQCPCFAADRECDPDVCRNCWLECGDGTLGAPPPRGESYQCKNMKVLLRQHQRILLGESDVQGWGAFIKSAVGKNEYLGEYTGELISHQEADRRGKIYDRENVSFLFDLDDQYVLDACRKGNKLKFANHSPNPNCYAKVTMVSGDHRVGIFSKEKIAPGEELFYDYGYTAGQAPSWWETVAEGHSGSNLRRNHKGV